MFSVLSVPDEVVIGFFSAVILGLTAAIGALWKRANECDRDRIKLWEAIHRKKDS